MAYEVEYDAFERAMPDAVADAMEQVGRKSQGHRTYAEQRLPFEVMTLYRQANGELSYANFNVRAFKTEGEALAHFAKAVKDLAEDEKAADEKRNLHWRTQSRLADERAKNLGLDGWQKNNPDLRRQLWIEAGQDATKIVYG